MAYEQNSGHHGSTVKPGAHPLDAHGPRDWDDLITHDGEARGLADTAYSTLEPDAPTVAAARYGHVVPPDRDPRGLEIPGEDNGPDS